MNIDGHCLFGKVGFSFRSEANWSCYCHCEDCRRNCAAPIVAFFGISLEDFSWRIEGGAKEPKFFRPHQVLNGFSGNPGGRPKDEFNVAELVRSYTLEAVETLVDLIRHSKDDRVRGTASKALLDRGWGKAKVQVATNSGQSYIEALQAAAEIIRLKNKER